MTQEPACRFLIVLAANDGEQSADPEIGLSRIAPAYYAFKEGGGDVALATLQGGPQTMVVIGPDTLDDEQAVRRFRADRNARDDLAETLSVSQIVVEDFDAAFCLGLSGRIWFDEDFGLASLLRLFLEAGKPVALVPGKHLDIGSGGAGNGLLIIGETDETSLSAARALISATGDKGTSKRV